MINPGDLAQLQTTEEKEEEKKKPLTNKDWIPVRLTINDEMDSKINFSSFGVSVCACGRKCYKPK